MAVRRLRRAPIMLAALAAAAISLPLGALAAHQFTDVPDSNLYHADIDALVDAGVTSGCGAGIYCPSAFVTREQMAAFLNRLGALSPTKTPVVNAAKLDGRDSTDFLGVGPIVIGQFGSWNLNTAGDSESGMTVDRIIAYTGFTSSGAATNRYAQLDLVAPISIDGQAFGFKSVTVCWDSSPNVTLTAAYVREVNDDGTYVTLINNVTPRSISTEGCLTLADNIIGPTGGNLNLLLAFDFTGAGTAKVTTTDVTWAAIPKLLVSGEVPQTGDSSGPGAE